MHRIVVTLSCLYAAAPLAADRPPNIVIIYTDDQGYGDVGCFGANDIKTPNIDRLAREGRRFTSFYVAQPVCSASRAALLTGCYPNRISIHGALSPKNNHGIHADETTLGEICQARGYQTAVFGKWHLGWQRPFLPLQNGFHEFLGIPYSNDMWPRNAALIRLMGKDPKTHLYPPLPLLSDNDVAIADVTPEDQTRFTQQLTQRAVDFIRRHSDVPFFLYVPHPMPHVPIFASDRFRGKSGRGLYGDVIEELDASVGEITATIDQLGLADNTFILFATDNGPWTTYGNHAGSPGPLREAKGTTFEGGIRVPCVMRWPGKIPAGTVCDEPLMTIDMLPTLTQQIGGELPKRTIDGKDVWPLIADQPNATSPHQAYFFYYHEGNLEAMRSGPWKLHFPHGYRTLGTTPPGRDGEPAQYDQVRIGLELYHLVDDIGESRDVAAEHPDVVARLSALADAMRQRLGDRLTNIKGTEIRPAGEVEPSPPPPPG